jgi:hypothetical protein
MKLMGTKHEDALLARDKNTAFCQRHLLSWTKHLEDTP